MEEKEREERIKQIVSLIGDVLENVGMPRNIREAMESAKKKLDEEGGDIEVKIGIAINYLTEVSEDVNISPYARSQLWKILSALEAVKTRKSESE